MRVAEEVPGFALAEYQKTVRALLRHPLITAVYPDPKTFSLVRRWADSLRQDFAEQFGYRLELHGQTARLLRTHDHLDGTRPAIVRDRTFDRQRYAYLALTLAVLGRAGIQITLGELADAVAADAARIAGLGLDTDRYTDRRAFVDVVAWLEERGTLRVADGSAASWASDPKRAEALYDLGRDVLTAIYRPSRVLQHLDSVTALLQHNIGSSDNAQRRAASQQARRMLVEQPVVYFADVDAGVRNHLRSPAIIEDIERLTGLLAERRADGLLLVDTASFSDARFPGGGAIAQAALLLLGEMADRIVDPDARKLSRMGSPAMAERQAALVSLVDAGLPRAGVFQEAVASGDDEQVEPEPAESELDVVRHPLITDSFLRTSMKNLMVRYGTAFGETWRADPDRLRVKAIELLEGYQIVVRVDGGVLVLPLAGRYRNVVAKVKRRRVADAALFEVGDRL